METSETKPLGAVPLQQLVQLRACLACKHHAKSLVGYDMCVRNVKYWRDVVTGEADCSGQTLCETERKSWLPKLRGYCGKQGRFFELNS